jgi:hypothetical protein
MKRHSKKSFEHENIMKTAKIEIKMLEKMSHTEHGKKVRSCERRQR